MTSLADEFCRIGARLVFEGDPVFGFLSSPRFSIDVRRHRRGGGAEYYSVSANAVAIDVLDSSPADQHLLLLVRDRVWVNERFTYLRGRKFLCGRDDRHWFAVAVPHEYGAALLSGPVLMSRGQVRTVEQAKESLKPARVVEYERARRSGQLRRVRGAGRIRRQGEWFFVPRPELAIPRRAANRKAQLIRPGSQPHIVEALAGNARDLAVRPWRRVYARGAVRHPDHRTIHLPCWHEVAMNVQGRTDSAWIAGSFD